MILISNDIMKEILRLEGYENIPDKKISYDKKINYFLLLKIPKLRESFAK